MKLYPRSILDLALAPLVYLLGLAQAGDEALADFDVRLDGPTPDGWETQR